jgi:hypothetical protein
VGLTYENQFILKLILIVRFACATLDVGHPIYNHESKSGCGSLFWPFRPASNVPSCSGSVGTLLPGRHMAGHCSGGCIRSTRANDEQKHIEIDISEVLIVRYLCILIGRPGHIARASSFIASQIRRSGVRGLHFKHVEK